MLNSGSRTGIRVVALMLAAFVGCSCNNDNLPTAPDTEPPPPESGDFALTCEANVLTKRLACGPQGSSSPQLTEGGARVIFGGQNLFVTLASSNVQQVGNTFSADVTLKNLMPQALGQLTTSSATAVRVFFELLPTNGVSVSNADGTATFTAAGQPYHEYSPIVHLNVETPSIWLDQSETSAAKNWQFDTSGISGSTFQFTVLVSADVLFPNGWVDIDQDPGAVEVSGGTTLTATVKDVVGRTVVGRTLTWTSLDLGVFTINSSSGLVSAGASNVTGTVQVASDGPEATGTGEVHVYQTLSARTPVTTPFTSGGERNYKFTVPGGGGSVRSDVDPIASQVRSNSTGVRRIATPENKVGNGSFVLANAPIVTSVLGISVDSTGTTTSSAPSFGADLHVRFGAPPNVAGGVWDCRPFAFGSREACTFDDPVAGDWFVTVDSPGDDFTNGEVNADFAATAAGYNIELTFLDAGLNADQQLAVTNAATRWSNIVTGDVRPLAIMLGSCGGERINLAIDDLYVNVRTSSVDGASGNLASAGPCFIRPFAGAEDQGIPVVGTTNIDLDDLPGVLADTATLGLVVVHELGHAMGIGGLWQPSFFDLVNFDGTDSVTYDGALGMAAYTILGGPAATEVPVANTGGMGTADAHWRETTFDNELMTGFLDSGANPLSLLSAQSLADEGYTVDTTAVDAYSLPGMGLVLEGRQLNPGIPFGNDIRQGPIYTVGPNGEFVRVR